MRQIKLRNERDERVAAAIIQSILRALRGTKSYDSDYDGSAWRLA